MVDNYQRSFQTLQRRYIILDLVPIGFRDPLFFLICLKQAVFMPEKTPNKLLRNNVDPLYLIDSKFQKPLML